MFNNCSYVSNIEAKYAEIWKLLPNRLPCVTLISISVWTAE